MAKYTRYTQIKTLKRRLTRACVHCNAQHAVDLTVVGVGTADSSPLLGLHEAAEERARRNAMVDIGSRGRVLLGLARCPQCAKRDAKTMKLFVAGVIAKYLGLSFVAACVALFVVHGSGMTTMLVSVAAAIAIALVVYRFAFGSPTDVLAEAAICVKFVDPTSPPPT